MSRFDRHALRTTQALKPDAVAFLEAHKARFREIIEREMANRPPSKRGFGRRLDAEG